MNSARPFLSILLLLGAPMGWADDQQRLIPWDSLHGQPHPDEAVLTKADWTTLSRQTLAPRLVQTLNRDWTFNYFPAEQLDTALLAPAADDAQWSAVALPHTWHTFETTRVLHPFIGWPSARNSSYWWNGWGVYRKTFTVDPKAIAGKRVFAEFDGVMKYCRVWLNGQELGDHKGGYGSFEMDFTAHLRPGANLLAVAVSARPDDAFRIPPMTAGNFDTYGGIYRDVRLVEKSPVHIPFQGAATHEGGTFVTTPEVTAERASVRVRTWVKNDDTQPRTVVLRTRLLDPTGKAVAQDEISAPIAKGELHEFDQPKFAVTTPQLWSIEKPVLYRVESEVRIGDEVVDRYASPLGLRWFAWNKTENRGYLNGKLLHLHGTNRHQEFPWLGDAVPKWIHVRDMADMRFGQGHNFLRTAHYTQDTLVYDLADRYGMLICEEVPNIKAIKFDSAVQRQQVVEMIRRDRNHPSIIMWSMGNETSDPADSAWAHAEDDTRLIHVRRSDLKKAGTFITHTEENLDMENLLRCTVRGWTNKDVANFQPANGQQAGTEEWQHAQAMVEGGSQRGRIDMPNGNMWIYADHGAYRAYLNCPVANINPKGWADLYRIPKYMFYLWQAFYTPEPMAFIHPHFWQTRYVGQKHDFIVDSNCDSVELFVNGRSVGVEKPSAEKFWNVTFKEVTVERGELRVQAKKGAQTVTRRVVLAGEPTRLTLTASHPSMEAARNSVEILTVDVVDASGVPVPEFARDLHWEITGPGKLVTPEVYTSDLKKREEMIGSFYIVAPVCAVVRSTGEEGEITVTVKAEGLPAASLKLGAKALAARPGFVSEPALSLAKRNPVSIAPAGNVVEPSRVGRAPKATQAAGATVLKPATEDLTLPRAQDRNAYKTQVVKWLNEHDPAAARRPMIFDELVDAFATHLANNGGLLVADDFNQRALQFNDACAIEDGIVARHLPASFATPLRRNYARRLIRDGQPLRVTEELQWIAALPTDAQAEVTTKSNTAAELFAQWYPNAAHLTGAQREGAFVRFQQINQASGTPLFDEKAKQTITYPVKAALLRPSLERLLEAPAAK